MSAADTLAGIRQRAEAATEGPWAVDGYGEWIHQAIPATSTRRAFDEHIGSAWETADAEFIAHARTDVPALVAALEAVLGLVRNVGNESTGPEFVACYEVLDAITTHLGGAR